MVRCDGCHKVVDTEEEIKYDGVAMKHWCYFCFPDYNDPLPIAAQQYRNHSQGR